MLTIVNDEENLRGMSYIVIMKLGKKTLATLLVLMIVALSGLIGLQYVLLANAFEMKQETFRQNVNAAMNAIVQSLETGEAVHNVYRFALKDSSGRFTMQMVSIGNDSTGGRSSASNLMTTMDGDSHIAGRIPQRGFPSHQPPVVWKGNTMSYTLLSPQHVLIRLLDETTGRDSVIVNAFNAAGDHSVELRDTAFNHGQFIFKFVSDSSSYMMEMRNGSAQTVTTGNASSERRTELVERVVDKLFLSERIPIEKRLSRGVLDSLTASTLQQSGITLPFAFGVISERDDSLHLMQPASFAPELRSSKFKTRLFPNDLSHSFNQLVLYFPGEQAFLLKQIGPHLALAVLFMGIIVCCFAYTIRTIIRQKEFSLRLMDFVNNMTHEFKTPISTISVAVETILHPAALHDEEKIKRYTGVIQDESARMKHQVDKILQMAIIEEGKYSLKRAPVDIQSLIAKAAENATLQVDARGGTIRCELLAPLSIIDADVVHLANVINNILDNAVKYSQEAPEIVVTTRNEETRLVCSVKDNGIGISEEDQRHVFERYFRVHTGNIHNVRGFGLGLAYVKLITEAHGGSVSLRSDLGRGTTVELAFPLVAPSAGK
jgi:two-component system phosphate regulon sensor histidine kinase PhoR